MKDEVNKALQIIRRQAECSISFPSLLTGTGVSYEEALLIFILRNAKKYVYAYYENAVTSFLNDPDFSQLMRETIEKGVKIQIVEVKTELNNTVTDIQGINIRAISSALAKQRNAEKVSFVISDDKMFGMRYDTEKEEWMVSFESKRTVKVLKEYFEECIK